MDINTVRIIVTLLGFGAFLWLVGWTWNRARRGAFDAAAQLPFAGEQAEGRS
jgi:cytochrome c oxidase cbb3-type subunit 4